MARSSDPNSATSQFFLNQIDNTGLDKANFYDGYGYCVFGEVVHGMNVVDVMTGVDTFYIDGELQNFPIPVITIHKALEMPEGYKPLVLEGTGGYLLQADINYNGIVGQWDLRALCENWLLEELLGDLPVEGVIDFGEFAGLAKSWQRTSVWKRAFAADIDNNSIVNFKDYSLLAQDWGKEGTELYGDLNLDGKVDYADIAYLADDWQKQAD